MANKYLDGAGDPLYGVNGTPADEEIPKYDAGDARLEFAADDGGAGGGGLVLLESHTASASSSLDFTAFISASYDVYVIVGESIKPATDNTNLLLEVGTGGGPTYDTGNNYQWGHIGRTPGGSTVTDNATTGIGRIFSAMDTASAAFSGSFRLTAYALRSTTLFKSFVGDGTFVNQDPSFVFTDIGLTWTNAGTAATALRFIMSSGNITSGTIRIYGLEQ